MLAKINVLKVQHKYKTLGINEQKLKNFTKVYLRAWISRRIFCCYKPKKCQPWYAYKINAYKKECTVRIEDEKIPYWGEYFSKKVESTKNLEMCVSHVSNSRVRGRYG